ncbi:unknown [Lachnospiraceae bacterium CAG:215]|nr:unknown [Lachnospiraceae bacterium CAG:215]
MCHICRRRCIRRATHSGFIRKQSSLDSDHDRASCQSSCHRLKIKRIFKNQREDFRQFGHIHDHRHDSDQNIRDCHDRNDHRCDHTDPVGSAPDHDRGCRRQNKSDYHRPDRLRIVRNIIFQRRRHIIRLQSVESICETDDQKYGKQNSHPTFAERPFHIVGRSSAELPVLFHLINLRQCTLCKCRSSADHSHQPHPKYRARSSCGDRSRNSRNISCPDTGSC